MTFPGFKSEEEAIDAAGNLGVAVINAMVEGRQEEAANLIREIVSRGRVFLYMVMVGWSAGLAYLTLDADRFMAIMETRLDRPPADAEEAQAVKETTLMGQFFTCCANNDSETAMHLFMAATPETAVGAAMILLQASVEVILRDLGPKETP